MPRSSSVSSACPLPRNFVIGGWTVGAMRSGIALPLMCTILCIGSLGTAEESQPSAAAAAAAPAGSTQQPAAGYTTLPPVVVTATRTAISPEEATNYVTVLSEDQIEQSPQLVLDDLLRQVTGFNTFRRSSSIVTAPADDPEAQGVTLRGIGPGGASRALVLLDGIPVNDAFGGWIYWDEIPLQSIERIEVVEGGGSNLWGNEAEGGVINIISKRPEDSRMVTSQASYGNRNTTQDSVRVNYASGPFRTSLEGDFFNTNGWNIVQNGFQGPIDQDASSIHELFASRVDFDPDTGLSAFLRGSYYNEDRDLGTPFRSASATRGFVNGGGALKTEEGDFHLSVYAHLSDYDQKYSIVNTPRTSEVPSQRQSVPSTDVGGFLTWTRTVSWFGDHQLAAGGDFRLIDGDSKDSFYDSTGDFIVDHTNSSGRQEFFGAYVEDVYRPLDTLEIDVSVRGDFFDSYDGKIEDTPTTGPASTVTFPAHRRTATSPRLGVRYDPLSWLTLRAGIYEAFRVPTLAELYRQSSVEDLVLLPNPNLSPEFLEGGEIGFQCRRFQGQGLTFGATAYWDILHHPISNVVTATNPVTGDDAIRTRVNLGRARIRGYQIDMEYAVSSLSALLLRGLSYLDPVILTASFLESEATLVHNPPDPTLEGRRLTLVPWQTVNIGLRYSIPVLGDLTIQEQYWGKQYEDADNHDVQEPYWVTNFTVLKTFTQLPTQWQWLNGTTAFAKVQNMFNQTYIVDKGGGLPKVGTPLLVQFGLTVPLNI